MNGNEWDILTAKKSSLSPITFKLRNRLNVCAVVEILYHTEHDYGADADGNRGGRMNFLDKVCVKGVAISLDNGKAISFDKLRPANRAWLEAIAETVSFCGKLPDDRELKTMRERHKHIESAPNDCDVPF